MDKSKLEVEILKSINPVHRNDDDKILELLEQLETQQVTKVEFEIKEQKIYLILKLEDEKAKFKLESRGANIEDSLVKRIRPTNAILQTN